MSGIEGLLIGIVLSVLLFIGIPLVWLYKTVKEWE